jgi:hypothetical protein
MIIVGPRAATAAPRARACEGKGADAPGRFNLRHPLGGGG